jgi:hypothetical protein
MPCISMDFTFMDSTNHRSKIFREKNLGVVTSAYNPRYLEDGDQEDHGSRIAQAKS